MREFEQDFEISCLFRQDVFVGCFVKGTDGLKYAHGGMETLYSGYCMGRNHKIRMPIQITVKEQQNDTKD